MAVPTITSERSVVRLQARDARPRALLIAVLAIAADRLTKLWVAAHIPMGGGIEVIPRVFRLTDVLNTGAAFSLFEGARSPQTVRYLLIGFSIFAAVVVLGLILATGKRWSLQVLAFALILGGAVGNLYDRIRLGHVIDFLEVHIVYYHWPDFNVADSCIVVGACLLLLDTLRPQSSPAVSSDVPRQASADRLRE